MRFFRRRKSDSEIQAELKYHLDQLIASNLREGMPEPEAKRRALAEFGSVSSETENCRDLRPLEGIAGFFNDLKYAVRRLRQAPTFTAAIVLSLAVGIGASAALFSLVNAAIFRTIPVSHPEQLVWFDSHPHGRALSHPFYLHVQADSQFQGVLCAFPTAVNVSAFGLAERADAELVSGNYFDVLGVRPHLGRLFAPDDDRQPVTVLSHAFWQTRLGGSVDIIGRAIQINGTTWTVVGVAPPGFGGLDRAYQRALFVPMGMKPKITPGWNGLDKPLIAWLYIAGRLHPGVDRQHLGSQLNARFQAFQEAHLPQDSRLSPAQRQLIRERRLRLEPLSSAVLDPKVASHLSTLGWIVALLLGLTCANVAGLLLSRGLERSRELATRLSIGASRGRIIRQLLAEAVLFAGAGGLAGLSAAGAIAPVLASRFPLAGNGSVLDVPMDLAVLAFALSISMLACLLFGVIPAWQVTKLDLISALKGSMSDPTAGRTRNILLAGQTALALVLLYAAGLFAVNLRTLLVQDTGFDRQHLLLAELEPTLSGYDSAARLKLYDALESRLHALQGSPFVSAAISNVAPMSPYHWTSLFLVKGRERENDRMVRAVAVGSTYFETMRIPLRAGRLPGDRDDTNTPRIAVISESLARREFPRESPIGQRFTADLRDPEKTTFEIVGVVADVHLNDPRNRLHRECVYFSYRQWVFTPQAIVLQARIPVTGSAAMAAAALRQAVRDVDPGLALYDVRTIEQATDSLLSGERMAAFLSAFFGIAAALLCALGIYGVASRDLAVRAREAAIRMALGGRLGPVLWHVGRKPLLSVLAGLTCGIVLLFGTAPLLRSVVTGVQPSNALFMAASAAALLLVAAAAIALPAWRVRRLHPASLLRQD